MDNLNDAGDETKLLFIHSDANLKSERVGIGEIFLRIFRS